MSDENDISIKVAVFKGKDKTDFIKRNEFGHKCIIEAMQSVESYIESLNETFIKLDGSLERKERKKFNIDAFREAWVNACIHNKWSEGVSPAVWFFEDRIEIFSNGSLPDNFSKEDFYRGISRPVNKELTDIYIKLHLIEQSGHGVPIVVKQYGEKAFEFGTSFIIVTIPFEQPFTAKNTVSNATVNATVKLSDTQKNILTMMRENPAITTQNIGVQLSIDHATVIRNIAKLKAYGFVQRIGSDKTGKWIVINQS